MAKKPKKPKPTKSKKPAPLAPVKPPPGDDACANCYFSTTDSFGIMHCCYNPPAWQRGGPPTSTDTNWPIVDPADWCGHGYNTTTNTWMTPTGQELNG